MNPPLFVGVLGDTKLAPKTITALLADRVTGHDANFLVPVTREHWTPMVAGIAQWLTVHKIPYEVLVDGSHADLDQEEFLASAKVTHKVLSVESKMVSLLASEEDEGILLMGWDDGDAVQRALDKATKRGVLAYNLDDSLNRLRYDDDPEEAAAVESDETLLALAAKQAPILDVDKVYEREIAEMVAPLPGAGEPLKGVAAGRFEAVGEASFFEEDSAAASVNSSLFVAGETVQPPAMEPAPAKRKRRTKAEMAAARAAEAAPGGVTVVDSGEIKLEAVLQEGEVVIPAAAAQQMREIIADEAQQMTICEKDLTQDVPTSAYGTGLSASGVSALVQTFLDLIQDAVAEGVAKGLADSK